MRSRIPTSSEGKSEMLEENRHDSLRKKAGELSSVCTRIRGKVIKFERKERM